jgi:DNA-binding IclR family transcriptional regulator
MGSKSQDKIGPKRERYISPAALGVISGRKVYVAAKREWGSGGGYHASRPPFFPLPTAATARRSRHFLPEAEVATLLKEKELYFQGDPAKFNREKTIADIERCRTDWFAEDVEETAPRLNAVAAPVLGPNSLPMGYIVVLGLVSAEVTHQCGPLVAEAGKALSRQLGARIHE